VNDAPVKVKVTAKGTLKKEIGKVLKNFKFKDNDGAVFGFKKDKLGKTAKSIGLPLAKDCRFHVYSKKNRGDIIDSNRLLVIKEANNKIMEVKEYVRR
jgi:hypothetical protein